MWATWFAALTIVPWAHSTPDLNLNINVNVNLRRFLTIEQRADQIRVDTLSPDQEPVWRGWAQPAMIFSCIKSRFMNAKSSLCALAHR
jgi:hypothetical protein